MDKSHCRVTYLSSEPDMNKWLLYMPLFELSPVSLLGGITMELCVLSLCRHAGSSKDKGKLASCCSHPYTNLLLIFHIHTFLYLCSHYHNCRPSKARFPQSCIQNTYTVCKNYGIPMLSSKVDLT